MANRKPEYEFRARDFIPRRGIDIYRRRINCREGKPDREFLDKCMKHTYILGVYNATVAIATIGILVFGAIKGLEALTR